MAEPQGQPPGGNNGFPSSTFIATVTGSSSSPAHVQQTSSPTAPPTPQQPSFADPGSGVADARGSGLETPGTPSTGGGSRPISTRGSAFYQRRRAVRACQVCRARRTKCDNLKPSCSFCLKVGATCVQSPVDLSGFDPASLKILERLDELEELVRSSSSSTNDGPPSKTRVIQVPGPAATETGEGDEAPEKLPLSMVMTPGPEHVISWAVFEDTGVNGALPHDRTYESASYAGSTTGGAGAHAQSPTSVLRDLDLEPQRINSLLDNFFSYVHIKNPILDESATRDLVLTTVFNGIDWSAESCLSLIICALGSIATPFGPSPETMPGTPAYNTAQTYFQAAQRRLGSLVSSDDILSAQCLFLSGVYMMCTFQPLKAWRLFVQALASCQQFPFLTPEAQQQYNTHSPTSTTSSTTAADRSNTKYPIDTLQQAIYWSSWKSEREQRTELYLPDFALTDKERALYPPFFPTPPRATDHPDQQQQALSSADPRLVRERTAWYFYLSEISLRRLAARISAEMAALRNQHGHSHEAFLAAMAEAVPRYEELAQGWINSLPPLLSFDNPAEQDDVCRFILRGHAIDLSERIYWPFIAARLDDSVPATVGPGFAGRSTSSQNSVLTLPGNLGAITTELAQRALRQHFVRLVVNRPGYRHRHHGTIPLMRSCSRSALVLAAAALKLNRIQPSSRPIDVMSSLAKETTAALVMPRGWRNEVGEVIKLLAYWEPETQHLSQVRRVLERACAMVLEPVPLPSFPVHTDIKDNPASLGPRPQPRRHQGNINKWTSDSDNPRHHGSPSKEWRPQ